LTKEFVSRVLEYIEIYRGGGRKTYRVTSVIAMRIIDLYLASVRRKLSISSPKYYSLA